MLAVAGFPSVEFLISLTVCECYSLLFGFFSRGSVGGCVGLWRFSGASGAASPEGSNYSVLVAYMLRLIFYSVAFLLV